MPPGVTLEATYGVRIVTPFAGAMRVPVLSKVLRGVEHRLMESKLAMFGGFFVAAMRKARTA